MMIDWLAAMRFGTLALPGHARYRRFFFSIIHSSLRLIDTTVGKHKMKQRLQRLILVTITATLSCSIAQAKPTNIVFFLVDDLGWSDVGSFGSEFYETPNIDQLAQDGVKFTNAYAASHVCSPTRASILTGKYPARLNLNDWISGRRDFPFQKLEQPENLQRLPLEEITLAEALSEYDYATGHFGKWHLGEHPAGPLQQGFDLMVPQNWFKGWPKAGYHSPFKFAGLTDEPGDYLTDRLTDEALVFLEEHKEEPFFLYLSLFSVHDPIQGRPDLVAKYRKKLAQSGKRVGPDFILEGNPDDTPPLTRAELDELATTGPYSGYKVLPNRTVKIKQHQDNVEFAAMVEAMDESLGRVVAKLEDLELTENTLVIFTSDNGGMAAANFANPNRKISQGQLNAAFSTSNLPLRGAKGFLYEGGIRVPAIIKWPGGGEAGVICETPIISPDFYPTILEAAGLPAMPEQTKDGVSLVPLLTAQTIEPRPLFWHFPHYSNHGMQSPGGAIRDGDYKLLEYFENGTVQLFNLVNDIGEQSDLSEVEIQKAKELTEKLHQWRKEVDAQMMVPNPNYNLARDQWSKPAK